MLSLNIRIALCSDMHTARLQNMYGEKYVVNVNYVKYFLESMSGIEYSLIIHDRDKTCNKAHLHLVVKSTNHGHLDLCKFKNLFPVGYMQECHNYNACLLYLLHYGHANAEKVQYDVDELFTNIDYCERFPFLKKGVH